MPTTVHKLDSSQNIRVLCFDVESLGLHGTGWAVGWVYFESDGSEIESGYAASAPDVLLGAGSRATEDFAWVQANTPYMAPNCANPAEVQAVFWRVWQRARDEGALLVADCAWPVESRFLAACVDADVDDRCWKGPYPLHDVATMRLAAGLDPLASTARRANEEPKHHPIADARQSGRLWFEARAAIYESRNGKEKP